MAGYRAFDGSPLAVNFLDPMARMRGEKAPWETATPRAPVGGTQQSVGAAPAPTPARSAGATLMPASSAGTAGVDLLPAPARTRAQLLGG